MTVSPQGYFTFEEDGPVLREIAEGMSVEDVKAVTEADFRVADNLIPMKTF